MTEELPHSLRQVLILSDKLHIAVDELRDLTLVTREVGSGSPGYVCNRVAWTRFEHPSLSPPLFFPPHFGISLQAQGQGSARTKLWHDVKPFYGAE